MTNIKTELIKKYQLKVISGIALLPILLANIIEKLVKSNFPQTNFFYNSSASIIAKIFTVTISIICFIAIRQLEKEL